MRLLALLFAGVCLSSPVAVLFLHTLLAFQWLPGSHSFELDALIIASMAIPIGVCFAWHVCKAV